jgi:hypothetical protein
MVLPKRFAITGILALGWLASAQAQTTPQSAAKPAPWDLAPITQPDFDTAAHKPLPNNAEAGNEATGTKIPKGLGLGKYQLDFDAKHSTEAAKSGVTMDSGETANLSKVVPGQKQVKALPNYFGLKLSTPTQ